MSWAEEWKKESGGNAEIVVRDAPLEKRNPGVSPIGDQAWEAGIKLGDLDASRGKPKRSSFEVLNYLRGEGFWKGKIESIAKSGDEYNAIPTIEKEFQTGYGRAYDQWSVVESWPQTTKKEALRIAKRAEGKGGIFVEVKKEPSKYGGFTFTAVMRMQGVGSQRNLPDWVKKDTIRPLRQNPSEASEAAALNEHFHGTPSTEILEYREKMRVRSELGGLGWLVGLRVKPVNKGAEVVNLWAPNPDDDVVNRISLAGAPGGHQEIDLDAVGLSGKQQEKDSVVIGEVRRLTYRTSKSFEDFEEVDFFHDLSEESKEPLPVLIYDTLNRAMSLSGGAYYIDMDGKVSRGIVN
jgi:hypothetical protein